MKKILATLTLMSNLFASDSLLERMQNNQDQELILQLAEMPRSLAVREAVKLYIESLKKPSSARTLHTDESPISKTPWTQEDIEEIAKLLTRFSSTKIINDFKGINVKKETDGALLYGAALAHDSLFNKIANRETDATKDTLMQYVKSGMTKYTVKVAQPYLARAISAIEGNTSIQQLTFTEYLTPSDITAVIDIADTMPALKELRLIDIRAILKDHNINDVVVALAEAMRDGKLRGLKQLVLSHFAFKPMQLDDIKAQLPGIDVRLSTDSDF
ncbi:MAG: hypothetical protein Q8K36_01465 [Alphaproteobacteria bacterium]|nr:hypothetical protein [Alphaproteobacteria bacterium]